MREERLIEITSEIMKKDGPLGKFAYISSLNGKEMEYIQNCINSSVYDGLNIYEKILKFSQDYLESKNISIMNLNSEDEIESRDAMNSYFEGLFLNDNEFSSSLKSRK